MFMAASRNNSLCSFLFCSSILRNGIHNNAFVTTMSVQISFVSSQTLFVVVGILALVAGNNPITFVVVIPVVIIFWILRTYYMKTSREVKRIEGISKYV